MLNRNWLKDAMHAALSGGADFCEIFVENRINSAISMLEGKVETAVSGIDFGVGLRLYQGTRSVYAYTSENDRASLLRLAKDAAQAIEGASKDTDITLKRQDVKKINTVEVEPSSVPLQRKVEVMRGAYKAASEYDKLVTQVQVGYGDTRQEVLIVNSDGLMAEDERIRTRVTIRAVASKDGEMQEGFYGPGASRGFELYDMIDVPAYAREAARIAVTMVNARPCPSGHMPVIIDNGFGGVVFHEACGHGLEATAVAKETSVYTGRLGEQVASPLVTAIDDGTIPHAWGSSAIDDEGNPTRRNVLIEKGILKGYMVDRLNGRKMGMESTGSARRQSYRFAPTSRMTNTFIDNGDSTKEEIIAATEKGLYAKYMGGGSVNTATGDFNFAVMEGYLVKDGKIDAPVRGATLIGKGEEVLKKIDMVGNNLDYGQGMCGSVSGSVPANVGQPTLRIESITVGGREES